MKTIFEFKTLTDFTDYFRDEKTCVEHFTASRFRNGEYCPHCHHDKIYRCANGKRYHCAKCKQDFTIRTKTVFGDSKLPLRKWYMAVYLLSNTSKGISSVQLAKHVGVTQKTAWFMDHRIRKAMKQNRGQLFGRIEADETFVGGKEKFKHANRRQHRGRGPIGKVAVMGLLDRHGPDGHSVVRAQVVASRRKGELQSNIRANVAKGSVVYTDALKSYDGLDDEYVHEVIDHSEAYVADRVHTNGIENFWSLFKRIVYGTHHSVDPIHLDRYLAEAVRRFNNRALPDSAIFTQTAARVAGRRLTYKELTA